MSTRVIAKVGNRTIDAWTEPRPWQAVANDLDRAGYRVYVDPATATITVRDSAKARASGRSLSSARGRHRVAYPFHLSDPTTQIPASERDEGPRHKAEIEAARARLYEKSEAYRRAMLSLQRHPSPANVASTERLRQEYTAAETSFTILNGRSRRRGHKRTLVRDAGGAYCPKCGSVFTEATNLNLPKDWTWRSSQKMHERGTGHTMVLLPKDWRGRSRTRRRAPATHAAAIRRRRR